jgi:ABC-type multidrug transport system fused ATPase/permease subunit
MDRLLSEVADRTHEIETRLALGATRFEAVRPTVRSAVKAALIPNLNQMAVVGLVSIPGMMTGQLLGGASPLVAAEYQMVILWLIFGTAALSTLASLQLCSLHAVYDSNHRLTPSRILKTSGKMDIDKAVYLHLLSIWNWIESKIRTSIPNNYAPAAQSEGREASSGMLAMTTSTHGQNEQVPGRACYRILANSFLTDSGSKLISDVSNIGTPVFAVRGYNILCGEEPLLDFAGLSIDVNQGSIVTIEGSSGIGKSRLLRSLCLLDEPLSGSLSCWGRSVEGGDEAPRWRSTCIYVPQALAVLAGTPKELLLECCEYRCRATLSTVTTFVAGRQ